MTSVVRELVQPILEIESLGVRYGGVVAVDSLNIVIRPGTLVGLIGPNGAGKTSCVDALSGLTRSTGSIRLNGSPIARLSPHRRTRHGLVRTFQSMELFEDLSVFENVLVAAESSRTTKSVARPRERAMAILESVGLQDSAQRSPSTLSNGQRKLMGVARGLASQPQVMLLDEPASGLDVHESRDFGRFLRARVDAGLSALLIEHDMGLVFDICDYIYVLEFGKLIAEGTPTEVRSNRKVIAAYLGEDNYFDSNKDAPSDGAGVETDRP